MSYSPELRQLIVTEITYEFQAAHTYRAYSAYFSHPDIALPGFSKFFKKEADEELEHADAFIKYYQDRGDFAPFPPIDSVHNDVTPVTALKNALQLEYLVRDNLQKMIDIADAQTQSFLDEYITIQTESIAKYKTLLTKTERMYQNGLIDILDKELLKA